MCLLKSAIIYREIAISYNWPGIHLQSCLFSEYIDLLAQQYCWKMLCHCCKMSLKFKLIKDRNAGFSVGF